MKTQQHMPHGDARKHPLAWRISRLESGITEYLVLGLVIILGVTMAVGLLLA